MQGFENGVIQVESIIIVAIVFVFLACAVVVCTAITAVKVLHGLPVGKDGEVIEDKTGPPMLKRVSLFAGMTKKIKRQGESVAVDDEKTDIKPPESEAAADGGEQTGELSDLEALDLDYDDALLEFPETESDEGEPDADDLDADEPDDVDTRDFDADFMCADDGFEYYDEDAV